MSGTADKQKWDMKLYMPLLLVMCAIIALYYPFLQDLIVDWDTNDDYSHGYFIPFISLYMIYSIREKLVQQPIRPVNSGLLLFSAGLAILIVAKIGSEFFLQRSSFIVVLLGAVLFFLGGKLFRLLFLPIIYLIFMIPLPAIIWNKIAFPMQLFGSYLTEHVIRFLGIPIYREGNVLHLVETTLEVVAACSGLRSLMTMFALAGLLAFISVLPTWKKYLLFFSAAPVAIVANIFRLSGTALLASKYGSDVAHGFLHDFSGLVVFALGFTMLISVNTLLSKTTKT